LIGRFAYGPRCGSILLDTSERILYYADVLDFGWLDAGLLVLALSNRDMINSFYVDLSLSVGGVHNGFECNK
jgi:hypothetical protein